MNFPTRLTKTLRKDGGRIEQIERIEHVTAKPVDGRSQDVWHFVGAVAWDDGTRSERAQIAPFHLCYVDDDATEVNALCDALNQYLRVHGSWFSDPPHAGWYAAVRPAAHCPKVRTDRSGR